MCDDQRNLAMAAPFGGFSVYGDLASHAGANFGHAGAAFS
jgi:hypothetical protein